MMFASITGISWIWVAESGLMEKKNIACEMGENET